jgi:hypothetical protein
MADRIIVAAATKPMSDLFDVFVDGTKVGQVYQDAPGCWLPYRGKPRVVGHPDIYGAITELLGSLNGVRNGG